MTPEEVAAAIRDAVWPYGYDIESEASGNCRCSGMADAIHDALTELLQDDAE